jgi:hypothetical protein
MCVIQLDAAKMLLSLGFQVAIHKIKNDSIVSIEIYYMKLDLVIYYGLKDFPVNLHSW